MAATVAYLASYENTTDGTTFTFTGVGFGTAGADRFIGVVAHSRQSGTNANSLSSGTIGGVAAAVNVSAQGVNGNSDTTGAMIAALSAGASGTVTVTFSQTQVRCTIDVYEIHGIDGTTAFATDSATTSDPSLSINVEAGGIAIAGSTTISATGATWTGITERVDTSFESMFYSSASDAFGTAQSPLSIGLTWAGTNDQTASVAVAWSPSGSVPPPAVISSGRLLAGERNHLVRAA